MKILDFFCSIFKTGTIPENGYDLDDIFNDYQNLYLKNLAIDKSAEFLARIFADSELRLVNIESPSWNYLLNVRPNNNESASYFWQKFIYRLVTQNEVLVIKTDDDQLLVADDYSRKEYAVYEDIFDSVTVKDFIFKRTFKMSEVIFLQYNNNRLSSYIDGLFLEYEKLHQRMVETVLRNNQIRGMMHAKGSSQFTDNQMSLMKNYADKLFKAFSERSVAIVPANDHITYEELTNTTGTTNLSVDDLQKIRRQFDDEIADILGIPPTVLHGDMATLDSSQKALVLYCMSPLSKKIQDELNAKIISKSDYQKGKRLKIVGLSQHDIFDIAVNIDKLVSSGTFTRNEVRERLDFAPIDGGDNIILTKNYIEEGKGGDNTDDTNTD
ncbi:TPA: phage portal protein [Streptococcus agalactiae]